MVQHSGELLGKKTSCTIPCYNWAEWTCCWMWSTVWPINHGGDGTHCKEWTLVCLVSSFPRPHQNCPGSIPGQMNICSPHVWVSCNNFIKLWFNWLMIMQKSWRTSTKQNSQAPSKLSGKPIFTTWVLSAICVPQSEVLDVKGYKYSLATSF